MDDEKYLKERIIVRNIFKNILSIVENKIGRDRAQYIYLGEEFEFETIGNNRDYVRIWPMFTIEWSWAENDLDGLSADEIHWASNELWKIKNLSSMFERKYVSFSIMPSYQTGGLKLIKEI